MALITARRYQVSAAIPVTIFAHLLVIAVTILVLVWLLHFEKGLAFQSDHNKHRMINMHTLLMILGTVLAGGEAIMAYQLTVHAKRRSQKAFHSILHFTALVLGLVGHDSHLFILFTEKAARAARVPWHAFIGMAIFLLTICTTETGLVEIFIHLGLVHSQEALLVNFIGLLVFLFAVSVSLTLLLPRVHK